MVVRQVALGARVLLEEVEALAAAAPSTYIQVLRRQSLL
jgi:hypothetical protein